MAVRVRTLGTLRANEGDRLPLPDQFSLVDCQPKALPELAHVCQGNQDKTDMGPNRLIRKAMGKFLLKELPSPPQTGMLLCLSVCLLSQSSD